MTETVHEPFRGSRILLSKEAEPQEGIPLAQDMPKITRAKWWRTRGVGSNDCRMATCSIAQNTNAIDLEWVHVGCMFLYVSRLCTSALHYYSLPVVCASAANAASAGVQ